MIIFSQLEIGVLGPTQLSPAIPRSSFVTRSRLIYTGTAPVNWLAIALGGENGSLIWPAELPFVPFKPDRAGLSKTILYGTF
jgi:hypothetical protein